MIVLSAVSGNLGEFSVKKLSIVLLVLGFGLGGLLVPADADAGQFHIKNCTPKRAFVCAYNSNDSSLAAAAEAGGIHAGKQKKFKCNTNRCKVFIGFSKFDVTQVLARDTLISVIAAPGAIDAAAETNAVCKKIINKVKHHNHAKSIRESRLSGHHTLNMFRDRQDRAVLSVGSGRSCP